MRDAGGSMACRYLLSPMNIPSRMEDLRLEDREKPSRRSVNSGIGS
jgi:hypothetical protein